MTSRLRIDGCVEQALEALAGDVRDRFAADPAGVLRADLGLIVTPVDYLADVRADGGACDGMSFLQDGVILYMPTSLSRRENFTLAHELGHWLVEQETTIYDWLADQDNPGRMLETVCDRIGQRLLLPASMAGAIVGSGPIRARHLFDLYKVSQASRPVCAIALARHLPAVGAIVIIDKNTREVTHASVNPDAEQGWPRVFPWRGHQLSDSHPLMRLAAGKSTTQRLPWEMPWGERAEFYVDALAEQRRVVAVLADSDLWGVERFHTPIERDFDTRPMIRGSCCGRAFERRGYPCSACKQPFCPTCGDCRCGRDARREEQCGRCFGVFLPHLIIDGVCVDCRS